MQCLTLAPTIKLKAKVASERDKQWLAGALHQLKQTSTGSLEGDVVKAQRARRRVSLPIL
jgi:hypothetical protein